MADNSFKTPTMFDPEKLVAAQRRNFEALTSAGQIVADGMRTCAERQAAMIEEAMRGLWGEMQTSSRSAQPGNPAEQLERMRGAFERVLSQVQELSQLLLRVQSEAMQVLNSCAAANMEALGGMTPDLANLQKMATEAMERASRQVTTAIDEMRSRMTDLQSETRQAMGAAGGAASAANATTSAASAATDGDTGGGGSRSSGGRRGGSTKS